MPKTIKRLLLYILNFGRFQYLILFLSIALLGSTSNALNSGPEGVKIFKYHVKQWENLAMVSDKFELSIYTLKTSNNIYNRRIRKGQILLIPTENVTVYKYPKSANLRYIAYKFYVRIKDVTVFDANLQTVEIIDEDEILPRHGFVCVPQLQEKDYVWPIMRQDSGTQDIFSGWGRRANPFYRNIIQFHAAWDILAMDSRDLVRASRSGRVIHSGWLGGYGRCIIIESVDGSKTIYAHLSSAYFKKGTYAKQGECIGVTGNTGTSTGPHLHFEVRNKKNTAVNPMNLLWARKLADNRIGCNMNGS